VLVGIFPRRGISILNVGTSGHTYPTLWRSIDATAAAGALLRRQCKFLTAQFLN
jgi:hypothetical protein